MTHTKKAWHKVTLLDHPEGFTMGPINAETWLRDPKHMGFMLSRYKFATKMMRRCTSIVEVGCGEGLGAMIGEIYPTTYFLTISRGTFSKGLGFADLHRTFIPLLIAIPVLIGLSVALLKKQEA